MKNFIVKILNLFKRIDPSTKQAFYNSIFAIMVGLLVGFIIMLIVNPQSAFAGFGALLTGGFSRGTVSFGNVLFKSSTLILVGLSVGFAFKSGLFNIGASGQFMVGGVAALYVANLVNLPAGIHFIAAVLAAIIGGAIWGSMPGILKAFFNVSEVIATIMLNYIGMYLSVMLVYNPAVYDRGITGINAYFPSAHTPTLGLNRIFPFTGSNIDISIIIAILIAVLIWFILKKTVLGYQLKAVGHSAEGSKYAGIGYKRNIIISMTIAGGLAGMAAAMNYLPMKPDYFRGTTQIVPYGFNGISVAFMAQNNPIGIIFSGVFISYLKEGAQTMQLFGYDKEIANIVMAVIIYTIAMSSFIGTTLLYRRARYLDVKAQKAKEGEDGV